MLHSYACPDFSRLLFPVHVHGNPSSLSCSVTLTEYPDMAIFPCSVSLHGTPCDTAAVQLLQDRQLKFSCFTLQGTAAARKQLYTGLKCPLLHPCCMRYFRKPNTHNMPIFPVIQIDYLVVTDLWNKGWCVPSHLSKLPAHWQSTLRHF